MILQIGLQVALPAFLLIGLWRGAFSSRLDWLLNILAVSAACLFVFLTARWDFPSYYLRLAWEMWDGRCGEMWDSLAIRSRIP